jgi:hypothetical protein
VVITYQRRVAEAERARGRRIVQVGRTRRYDGDYRHIYDTLLPSRVNRL